MRERAASSGMARARRQDTYLVSCRKRDGWMHLYVVDVAAPGASREAADERQVGGRVGRSLARREDVLSDHRRKRIRASVTSTAMSTDGGARTKLTSMAGSSSAEVSPDGKMLGVIVFGRDKPPEVYLMANAAGATTMQVTTSPSDGVAFVQVGRAARSSPTRRATARRSTRGSTRRRWSARSGIPRRRPWSSCTAPAICRTRTSTGRATTASTCSITCSRRRATSCSTRLSRQRRLRPRLAHRDLSSHGRQGSRGRRRRRELPGEDPQGRTRSGSASTAAATAASSR